MQEIKPLHDLDLGGLRTVGFDALEYFFMNAENGSEEERIAFAGMEALRVMESREIFQEVMNRHD